MEKREEKKEYSTKKIKRLRSERVVKEEKIGEASTAKAKELNLILLIVEFVF